MIWNATTSKVANTNAVFANYSRYSFMCWFRALSAGEGGNGKLFSADDSSSGALGIRTDTTTTIRIRRDFATSFGSWDVPYVVNSWHCFAYSHDASSTANDPVAYVRNVANNGGLIPVTVTQTTAPSGGLTGVSAGYCVGNFSDQTATFDGDICYVQFWNRLLTQREFEMAMVAPGIISNGLTLNLHLINDFKDYAPNSSGKHGVATAMAKGGRPPGVTPHFPRRDRPTNSPSRPFYFNRFILNRRKEVV